MARPIPDLDEMLAAEVAADDSIVIDDTSAGETKRIDVSELLGLPNVGWTAAGETWSFVSYNSTTRIGVIQVPTNATNKYAVNNYVKITQTTGGTKYAKILSLTATQLTVWFPSGITLNNETISAPMYSPLASPIGVPITLVEGNPYSFSVWRNGAAATSAGGAWYPPYDVEEFDMTDCYNTSNGRFTAPVAGRYQFNFGGIIASPGMGASYFSFDKNGSEHKRVQELPSVPSGNNTIGGSAFINLAAGDYINVRYSTGSAANLVVGNQAYNWFNGFLESRV